MNDNNPVLGARRAVLTALPALRVLQGARTRADAERAEASLAAACTAARPAWYREDRATDRYVGTLPSGVVLAWTCIAPGEPLELMAWSSEWAGACVWREA
ncbi:hypothetical protein [Methylobacterium sp. yr596]|uniref:hypothetical protein n=1 Tax=Methylobacterium TaxID=407 RepID=UPI0008EFD8F7|nr:hypothetical protein [Methylobacterium sp. yr596]SFE90153.1 hypothetical protein SAMN04487844_107128 [Methylobacterium sp. yr596]